MAHAASGGSPSIPGSKSAASARGSHAIEEYFPAADHYVLFTGHLSEGNLRLYNKLGYTEFRKEEVSPRLQLVYLEKLKRHPGHR
jgi:hypothetical protein